MLESWKNQSEQKPSSEIIEQSKKEAFQQLKNFTEKYDFPQFSWESLYAHIKRFKSEIKSGNNTLNFDLNSFNEKEMGDIWSTLDKTLIDLKNRHLANMKEDSEEYRLLNSSTEKWQMDYDGKVKPYIENPILLGGVHGDERTLPDELNRLLKYNNEIGLYKLNSDRSYINHQVNLAALEQNARSFSVSENQPSNESDMNRPDISDPITKEVKTETLKEIAKFKKPFIVDMHNEKTHDEKGLEQKSYLAFVDDENAQLETNKISDKLLFKIKLAQQFGVGKVIIVDPEIAKGTLVEDIKFYNSDADGMVIEIPKNDTGHSSSKIALKYLSINGVINDGNPSMPLQMEYLLSDSFMSEKSSKEMEILLYKVNKDVDENLHPINIEEGKEYLIRNGVAITIEKVRL